MTSHRILIKIANWLDRKNHTTVRVGRDLSGQKNYVRSLGIPKDKLERSYFQYKCQMKLAGAGMSFLYNMASILLNIAYLAVYSNRHAARKAKDHVRAVFLNGGNVDVIPRSLYQEYGEIRQITELSGSIHKEDMVLLKRIIRRYPFSPFFLFKIILKTAQYNAVFERYEPEAIIVCNEYSYTSSYMTYFCNLKHAAHINVMHGDKCYYIRDAFFQYDRCYVWDEHYIKLFQSLMAAKGQFRIETPPCLLYQIAKPIAKGKDYTYYLQVEDIGQLQKIARYLEKLKDSGCKVAYRPHPIYEHKMTRKILRNIHREDCRRVSIEHSVLGTRYVIARTSTVLLQAYYNGVDIVLDDITDPEEFRLLEDMDVMIVHKRHLLLSELLAGYYLRTLGRA